MTLESSELKLLEDGNVFRAEQVALTQPNLNTTWLFVDSHFHPRAANFSCCLLRNHGIGKELLYKHKKSFTIKGTIIHLISLKLRISVYQKTRLKRESQAIMGTDICCPQIQGLGKIVAFYSWLGTGTTIMPKNFIVAKYNMRFTMLLVNLMANLKNHLNHF